MRASSNRQFAVAVGGLLVLFGVLGYVLTPGVPFAATSGPLFLGAFAVNPALNLTHVALGLGLGVAGLVGRRAARAANLVGGLAALGLGMLGLFIAGTEANVLALNGADNALHFAISTALLAVSLGARPETAADAAPARAE